MLDPKIIRSESAAVAEKLAQRQFDFDVTHYLKIEETRKKTQMSVESLRQERNAAAKAIGQAKAKGESVEEKVAAANALAVQLKKAEQTLEVAQSEIEALFAGMPNIAHESVPVGKDEAANVEIRRWGDVQEVDDAKDHVDIAEHAGWLSFEQAAKMSGSRFAVLKGDGARLHRALAHFMLDMHTQQHGYEEVAVPYLVNSQALFGTGQLPKFEEDLFKTSHESGLFLIPTAEVPLTNLAQDHIFSSDELPLRWVAHTPCFRSEAGSYGRDTRGLIRQHQFDKVELVQIVAAEKSYQALDELTGHAEAVLKALDLPYRTMLLSTGDMGFSASRTHDLEVWLPSQKCYREISSCSNCEDFQARRLKARYRVDKKNKPELVHTLNGSGVAVGRAWLAVIENYLQQDGSVAVPTVLKPYLSNQLSLKISR